MPRNRRAFTLVELLVTMSVISILAAIILPVTMRARSLARNVQCCASLGQAAKAVDIYLDEHDTWYPCYLRTSTYRRSYLTSYPGRNPFPNAC